MRETNFTLPPRHLLEALRKPRRPQLHDHQVREIFRRWRLRGEPIEYADLNEVAAIVAPGDELDAAARRRIIAAVERAGIRICNYDSFREWLRKTGHVSLTEAIIRIGEEANWRWPPTKGAPSFVSRFMVNLSGHGVAKLYRRAERAKAARNDADPVD